MTVNCVAPGLTATPSVLAKRPDHATRAERTRRLGAAVGRVGRVGRLEEVATAVCAPCPGSAAYTTGGTAHVNGGSSMP